MSQFSDAWETFKEQVSDQLVQEMSDQSPISDSIDDPAPGTLADSHSAQDGDGGRLEIVSTDPRGPIARYVILGTQPHPIDPVVANALHWHDQGTGDDVFAGHVDHPGTQPNAYNEVAWENQRDAVVQQFKTTVGKGVALAYLNPWRNKKI
jgi:hypothetical protein